MTSDEILSCAREALRFGYGTVVMQSGEDIGIPKDWLTNVIRNIKKETGLAVTLSVGEREDDELAEWKEAGADRYLMRFETSSPELYSMIHPNRGDKVSDRISLLRRLRSLGYEIGSGIMVGIPGQTYDDLARDILMFHALDLDMIGLGPYIRHPDTPLGRGEVHRNIPADQQVPNDELTTYKVLALTRLICPYSNIPSTTALATINRATGRELGLRRGANVVMPNITPVQYRKEYQIYPGKACLMEGAIECNSCMQWRIQTIGRSIGRGPGNSYNINKTHIEYKDKTNELTE
jgi:biotin synthase